MADFKTFKPTKEQLKAAREKRLSQQTNKGNDEEYAEHLLNELEKSRPTIERAMKAVNKNK